MDIFRKLFVQLLPFIFLFIIIGIIAYFCIVRSLRKKEKMNISEGNYYDANKVWKIINELKKNDECYKMKALTEDEYVKNKNALIQSIKSIEIHENKTDFMIKFSELYKNNVINEDDIKIISSFCNKEK